MMGFYMFIILHKPKMKAKPGCLHFWCRNKGLKAVSLAIKKKKKLWDCRLAMQFDGYLLFIMMFGHFFRIISFWGQTALIWNVCFLKTESISIETCMQCREARWWPEMWAHEATAALSQQGAAVAFGSHCHHMSRGLQLLLPLTMCEACQFSELFTQGKWESCCSHQHSCSYCPVFCTQRSIA